MTYVAEEGTPLPCGCPCSSTGVHVLDDAGQEVDRVTAADPAGGVLHRYRVVDGDLVTDEERRAFTLRCDRHPGVVVRGGLDVTAALGCAR